MSDKTKGDDLLTAVFQAAKSETQRVPPDLTRRVIEDAHRQQRLWAAGRPPSRWRQFLSLLGGGPAFGGLVAAGVAGVWLGISPPSTLDPVSYVISGWSTSVEAELEFWQDALLSDEDL